MKAKNSPWLMIIFLLAGCMIGSALWSIVTPILPSVLGNSFTIGSTGAPWTLNLAFITLTFGIVLSVNIGSVLGMIIALILFYKL